MINNLLWAKQSSNNQHSSVGVHSYILSNRYLITTIVILANINDFIDLAKIVQKIHKKQQDVG